MNPSEYERRAARRRALQKKRRRQVMMMKGIILTILLVILALSCTAAWRIFSPSSDAGKNSKNKVPPWRRKRNPRLQQMLRRNF